MRGAGRRFRFALPVCAVAVPLVLTGCLSMPTGGTVHTVGDPVTSSATPGVYYDPQPPTTGAEPTEIVTGFLEAMKATPIKTTVAQQFLTREARGRWRPEQRTVTYDDMADPVGTEEVRVRLIGAGAYDIGGGWQGTLDDAESDLTFGLERESGQWRIASLPNALVVPATWFAERFTRAARYFFDPTGTVLVPEPVFVPGGDQFTAPLVRGLLAGPGPELEDVLRTSVPADLNPGLSVPVNPSGVVDVQLTGPDVPLSAAESQRMVAQFVWTLRQEARVRAVNLSLNGRPLLQPGLTNPVPMDSGARYNPVGAGVDRDVYGVRDGRVVGGEIGDVAPVTGPWGETSHDVAALAVDTRGAAAAAVSSDRSRVLLGPVGAQGTLDTVATGQGFLTPVWDLADRLWLVDRPDDARLWVRTDDGVLHRVSAPGLAGRRVKQVLVSRDGTRVVALVQGRRRDRVLVSRVRQDRSGQVLGLARPTEVWLGNLAPDRLQEIGWRSPVALAVLSQVGEELYRVQTVGIDGAPVNAGLPATIRFRADVRGLLTSPAEREGLRVVVRDGVLDLETQQTIATVPHDLRLLTYTG